MTSKSEPNENRLSLEFETLVGTELNILLCALRGGFTSEAVASFRSLGSLMQSEPECCGQATIRIMDRDEAVTFLQHLSQAQEQYDGEENSTK